MGLDGRSGWSEESTLRYGANKARSEAIILGRRSRGKDFLCKILNRGYFLLAKIVKRVLNMQRIRREVKSQFPSQ